MFDSSVHDTVRDSFESIWDFAFVLFSGLKHFVFLKLFNLEGFCPSLARECCSPDDRIRLLQRDCVALVHQTDRWVQCATRYGESVSLNGSSASGVWLVWRTVSIRLPQAACSPKHTWHIRLDTYWRYSTEGSRIVPCWPIGLARCIKSLGEQTSLDPFHLVLWVSQGPCAFR